MLGDPFTHSTYYAMTNWPGIIVLTVNSLDSFGVLVLQVFGLRNNQKFRCVIHVVNVRLRALRWLSGVQGDISWRLSWVKNDHTPEKCFKHVSCGFTFWYFFSDTVDNFVGKILSIFEWLAILMIINSIISSLWYYTCICLCLMYATDCSM